MLLLKVPISAISPATYTVAGLLPRLLDPIGYVLVQHDQAMLSFVDSQGHTLLAKLYLEVSQSMVHDSVAQPLHFPYHTLNLP